MNLKAFCHEFQHGITEPIKYGPHLYATDGVIMIRVDAPDPSKEDDTFASNEGFQGYARILNAGVIGKLYELPPDSGKNIRCICFSCASNEDGMIVNDCEECQGTGTSTFYKPGTSHIVGNRTLADQYLHLIKMECSNPKLFLPNKGECEPIGIVFDGGLGLLMPKKKNT